MPEGIDTEYLMTLINQIRCKNNGIISHIHKKGFKDCPGVMIHGEHFSIDYLREKSSVIDLLLNTIIMQRNTCLAQLFYFFRFGD